MNKKKNVKNTKSTKSATTKNYFNIIATSPVTKYGAIALCMLIVIVAVCVARPFAGTVDNAEKIEYALHANDFRIDRFDVIDNDSDNVQDWKYLAVIENDSVTIMAVINVQQYINLHPGDTITGNFVTMTNGAGCFAFEDETNCEVLYYTLR
jgi:hypothetical protein